MSAYNLLSGPSPLTSRHSFLSLPLLTCSCFDWIRAFAIFLLFLLLFLFSLYVLLLCSDLICELYPHSYAFMSCNITHLSLSSSLPLSPSLCVMCRGDWASAAQIASHMLVSPVILLGPVRRKPEKDPHTHNTRRYAATAVMKDKKERDFTAFSPFTVRSTSPYNSSSPSPSPSSKVSNCLKDCASITDFSREHYLKLPRFFHNRIFAIRDSQTRAAAAAAATAASAVTAADAAASVKDSPVVSDTRNNVDSSSSDKQQ